VDWESVNHPTLHRLWEQARSTLREVKAMARRGTLPGGDRWLTQAATEPAEAVFWQIGLYLERPLEKGGYHCTPSNSLKFAVTGGEGIHFSFVLLDGRITAESPVVMTVPACFWSENVIVGANLDEFLGLGMFRGYWQMEYLAYKPQGYAELYSVREPWPDVEEGDQWLLRNLAEGMDLHPWDDVRRRLNNLQREFSPLLNLDHMPSGDNELEF
jgi:hypothetical protein